MGKLQEFYAEKDKSEPFSTREERTLTKSDKYFIRDIQMVENVNKQKAVEIYRSYKNSSIAIRREYRQKLEFALIDSPQDKTAFHIKSVTREQKNLIPYIKPDKEKEMQEEKKAQDKLNKIYAYLHGGRYIPLQGDSRHFYDVETDKVVTLHSYRRGMKEAGIKNTLPKFGKFSERREERKREILKNMREGKKEE